MRAARLLILLAALGWPTPVVAQDTVTRAFLTRATIAADRYRDLDSAIAAGYRAVGPELPAMGQHWIQLAFLSGDRFDPDQPSVLEYITLGGRNVLVGVAYAILLAPGASPPDAPVPSRWWHTHGGDLDEESLSDSHAGAGELDGDGVAVLHAWVPVANPAGPFVAENWALPFLRAGLVVPAEFSIPSARALALGTGTEGLTHFIAQFRRHAHPDATTDSAVVNAFTVAHDTIAGWLAGRDGSSLSAGELRWLDGVWQHVEAQVLASHITSRRD